MTMTPSTKADVLNTFCTHSHTVDEIYSHLKRHFFAHILRPAFMESRATETIDQIINVLFPVTYYECVRSSATEWYFVG